MKNVIRGAVLVLSTGMLFAQGNQSAQTSVGQPTDTNEPVYKGCLTGTKNNYMLTTVDGKSYRLHSDKDIDDHINHNVEVRGSIKKEGGDRSPSAAQQFQEIDVADLKSTGKESCTGPAAANNTNASNTTTAATGSGSMNANTTASAPSTATPAAGATAASTTASAPATTTSKTTVVSDSGKSHTATGTDANLAGAVGPSDQAGEKKVTTTTTTTTTSGAATTSNTDVNAAGGTSAGADANAATLPQGDQGQQTAVGGVTDTNEPLFKGCVAGKKDKYTLTTDSGEKYRLHSDKDINEHVGDRVEIRGTLKPEGDGKKVNANSKWKGELDVADIKTVEDGTCKQ